jgi:hypothetical protein
MSRSGTKSLFGAPFYSHPLWQWTACGVLSAVPVELQLAVLRTLTLCQLDYRTAASCTTFVVVVIHSVWHWASVEQGYS